MNIDRSWIITIIVVVVLLAIVGFIRQDNEVTQPTQNTNADAPIGSIPPEVVDTVTSVSQENIEAISETVQVVIKTSMGDIEVELYGADAPQTVGNFVMLANADFYDGTTFHRVIPGFMIQAGDPLSKNNDVRQFHGSGGPGYVFEDEINDRKIIRGSVAMANGGPNTNGSQFFIVTAEETPHLDGLHTNFGAVTSGMDIVDAISRVERDPLDNPLDRVVIEDIVISR